MIGYDKLSVNHQMLLDLPFREGAGVITHDIAMPHHQPITLQYPGGGSFTWTSLVSGLPCLEFVTVGLAPGDGVYLDCPNANTLDLDFTSGDYSILVWVNHDAVGNVRPKIVIGRYEIDAGVLINNAGWEVYLETNGGVDYLELRHHHGSLGTWADQRDGSYSVGWTTGTWDLIGITRHKIAGTSWPQHYRNGVPVTTTYSATGLRDPDTCTQDLVIGSRFTNDQDWYKGYMSRPRIVGRELSADDMKFIFESERHWYGA